MSKIASGQCNGFTLIEVMAALLISVFLLSGVVSMALSSRQSSLIKDDIDRMQENLRLSSSILTRTLSMAESLHQDSDEKQIIVSYSSGDGVIDCLGNSFPSGIVINHFYVKNHTLYCGTAYPEKPDSEQPLIEDVERMTVQYGIDENQRGQADYYTSKPGDLSLVISTRIALQLLSPTGSSLPVVTMTIAMRPRIFSHLNAVSVHDDRVFERRSKNVEQLFSSPLSRGKCVGHQFIDAAGDYRAWGQYNNGFQFAGADGELSETIHHGFTGG